ncbi:MAG: creatininase family protein [Chloroflexi bacterium]|nr:creatininase family protein [Chloroflexota bacterium]
MLFADLNWMDVESYLQHDNRVILITGATEQHAYLSLLTDIRIPTSLAMAVAQRTNVLIAPPLNFGVSDYFMDYPGTITINQATFDAIVTDIVTSLIRHGFRRILLLNGHGGNQFPVGVQELTAQMPELKVVWHNWWKSPAVKKFAAEINQTPDHANWLENFPFTRVAESPKTIKPFVDIELVKAGANGREVLGDGSFGGAYQISNELMQAFFDRLVHEITEIVEKL